MTDRPTPMDQAAGLRQMFAKAQTRFVPVVSNPHLVFGGVLLERLCTALGELNLHTLVVDASERAAEPAELARFDLAEGLERLSQQVSYLSARGLPLRFVDASGSTQNFLSAVADAAPFADVVLLHAPANDLARLFAHRAPGVDAPRAVLLCDERPEAVTHAYAALKLLATRCGVMVHDLLLAAMPQSQRAALVAERLAQCADDFLGAVLHDFVCIDPAEAAADAPSAALRRLVAELLPAAWLQPHSGAPLDSAFDALMHTRAAALPSSHRVPVMN